MNLPLPSAASCRTRPATPTDTDGLAANWQRRVARAFSRAASGYAEQAVAQAQMAESLGDYFPAQARSIVDVGCGPGSLTPALRRHYPEARLLGVDVTPAMLDEARRRHGANRMAGAGDNHWLCADAARLPLRDGSQDLVVSNLAIQWCLDLPAVLAEFARVTRRGGRTVVNTLAPGTLAEIDLAWSRPTTSSGVLAFSDLATHRQAAALGGWRRIHIRQRQERFYYADLAAVMASIKGVGAQVARDGVRLTRGDIERARARYETLRTRRGLPVSYQCLTLVLEH